MRKRKSLLWQIYAPSILILLTGLAAIGWYSISSLREFYYDQKLADLEARALLVKHHVGESLSSENASTLNRLSRELGRPGSFRVTFILESGKVAGDSEEDPERMDNHLNRPEVLQALKNGSGTSMRYSKTVQANMMYFALAVQNNKGALGVVRVSIPLTVIDRTLKNLAWKISLGGLAIALLAAGFSLFFSRRISRPLEMMKESAQRFAAGDMGARIPVPDSEEIGGLAQALNQMAAQLDDRIKTITAQRNEQETILSSMAEGIFAVDMDEKLINMNQTAANLVGILAQDAPGKSLPEAIRNSQLQKFIRKALSHSGVVEEDITLMTDERELFVRARATVLKGPHGKEIGALIVLNDVTRLRRLENVRRDFVANVSHELKTPITSIKGFVETLLQGGMEDKENAKRFLEIIAKQSDRLHAIIEDLLSLSRIEQESEKSEIVLKQGRINDVLQAVIHDCSTKAAEQNIRIDLECEENLQTNINQPLLQQAVLNLVDNALKYSQAGSSIWVQARRENNEIVINVRDNGCGIPAEHLPRLFERFYRVDAARSRALGGTGLGLAIVKHIAQAHGGRVEVQSSLAKGSTFSIHLPAT